MSTSLVASWIAAFMTAALLAGIVLDFLFVMNRSRRVLAGVGQDVPWGVLDAVAVVLLSLVLRAGLDMGLIVAENIRDGNWGHRRYLVWISNFIVDLLTVGFLAFLLKLRYASTLRHLGLGFAEVMRNVRAGFIYYIGALPVLLAAGLATKLLSNIFDIPLEPQAPLKMIQAETSVPALVLIGIFVVLMVPFFEELFFRGFLYPMLKRAAGLKWAMLTSACLFSALHFSFLAFLPVVCIGLILCYLYERTGSLLSAIVFHILNNFIAFLIVVFVLA